MIILSVPIRMVDAKYITVPGELQRKFIGNGEKECDGNDL